MLDTNVLVSALLRPDGPPGQILDMALAGVLVPILDDRVFAEYRDVLRRPRFGFPGPDVDTLLEFFEVVGVRVSAPPVGARVPDASDLPFLEVAVAGGAAALITGNARHFPDATTVGLGIRVLSPAAFLTWWHARYDA